MNSFLDSNRNFMKELQTSVRGLNLADRNRNYLERFQIETRARLKAYYSKLADISEKKAFYEEAFSSLMEFEFQFLVLSIYFDLNPEILFTELRNTINRCIPLNYKDEYGLLRFTTIKQVNTPSLRDYLATFFDQTIGLRDLPFGKGVQHNSEIYHICKWLANALKDSANFRKILVVLLHYNRYWQVECSDPYRHAKKGIILLDKVNHAISDIPIDLLKINLHEVNKNLKAEVSSLLTMITPSPFIDDSPGATARNSIGVKGYLSRLSEFNQLLDHNSIFFENFFTAPLSSIVDMHRRLNSHVRPYFEKIICKSFLDGRGLKAEEYDFLKSLRCSVEYTNSELKDFCDKLIAVNYLHELK